MKQRQTHSRETIGQWIARNKPSKPKRQATLRIEDIDVTILSAAFQASVDTHVNSLDPALLADYEHNLQNYLQDLSERVNSGRYQALPDAQHAASPLALFEDHLLQQTLALLLTSNHQAAVAKHAETQLTSHASQQALAKMWRSLLNMGGGWVVDLNLESLCDSANLKQLQHWLQHLFDHNLYQLLKTWLQNGTLSSELYHSLCPQILNLSLQHTLQTWSAENDQPHQQDHAFILRYGNNAVLGFTDEAEAEKLMAVLPEYFVNYSVSLHPDNHRLVYFLLVSQDTGKYLNKPLAA